MALHYLHDRGAGFTNVLLFASFACNAINEIGALASYVFLASVFHSSAGTGYSARPVKHWLMLAAPSATFISPTLSTLLCGVFSTGVLQFCYFVSYQHILQFRICFQNHCFLCQILCHDNCRRMSQLFNTISLTWLFFGLKVVMR